MSQLIKLKGALPAHLLRAPTIASTSIIGHQNAAPRHQSTAARTSIASQPTRAFNTTAARRAHDHATHTTALTSAASSQSHSSGASSSSILFGLLGIGAGGILLATTQDVAHAEAALPSIDISAPVVSQAPEKKKAKSKKPRGPRRDLPYPGKLSKLHQSAEQVTTVHVGQGIRGQIQASAYPPDPLADKSVTIIPIFDLGGPSGPNLQLIAVTQLGRRHGLEGYADAMGNVTGHYKFTTEEKGFSCKPSFQLTSNGNMAAIDFDAKRKEQAFTLSAAASGEVTATFNQSLTQNLVGGVEVHYAMMNFVHLNGGLKYSRGGGEKDTPEQFAVSKKDGKYTASYWRQLQSEPHFLAAMGFPPQTTQVGVESSFSTTSQKSEFTFGLKHARQTYNYQVAFTTAVPAVQFSFDTNMMADAPNLRWGLTGQVNYDGSGESAFGLNIMINV